MSQTTYELGGVATKGLGRVSSQQVTEEVSLNTGLSGEGTELVDISSPIEEGSAQAAGHHGQTVESTIRPNGTSIRPLLYWGFFTVIALAVMTTLINNTQFNIIEQELQQQDTYRIDVQELQELVSTSSTIALGMALVVILVGLGVATVIGNKLARQINQLSDIMYRLANGDYDVEVRPKDKVGAELARMYDAVNVFKANAIEIKHLYETEGAELRKQKDLELKQRIEHIAKTLDEQIVTIFDHILKEQGGTAQASDKIEALSSKLNEAASTSAEVTNVATESTNRVTDATQELATRIHEIATHTSESRQLTDQAVARAEDSNERIKSLETLADRIGEFITLIQDIAAKTNLLALNATIEASRAGEAGKGFSVVANEVKQLANQTAKATEEISEQVEGIRSEVGLTVDAMSQISQVIEKLSDVAVQISENVEHQTEATDMISGLVQHVTDEIRKVDETITLLAEDAETTYQVSEEISVSSKRTSDAIEKQSATIRKTLQELTKAA